jgi:hypothetical protein
MNNRAHLNCSANYFVLQPPLCYFLSGEIPLANINSPFVVTLYGEIVRSDAVRRFWDGIFSEQYEVVQRNVSLKLSRNALPTGSLITGTLQTF